VQFNWKPSGQGANGKKLDLTKVTGMTFSYPYAKIPAGKCAEFYLIDTKITGDEKIKEVAQ